MIRALSLQPYPPLLTQQWVEMYAWPADCRRQRGWGKDRYVTDWKLECVCWKRQSEIIKKGEQRAPSKLSRFMGGGYAADGLLRTYKWHSTAQYFKIVHKIEQNNTYLDMHRIIISYPNGSQSRQRYITPHTELKSSYSSCGEKIDWINPHP